MDESPMTQALFLAAGANAPGLIIAFGFAVGGLLGLLHFGALWWIAQLYGRGSALQAFALQMSRFALLLIALAGLAKLGALPLLAAALGLLVSRSLVMRRLGKIS
jgi:hypothetical protein